MRQIKRIIRVTLVVVCFSVLSGASLFGQFGSPISGPSPVTVNTSHTYTLGGGYTLSSWIVQGGTINSSTSTTVNVTWTQVGSGTTNYVGAMVQGSFGPEPVTEKFVTVNASPPSAPPVQALSALNNCGSTTLSHIGKPSGVTWYWQGTNASGTSTAYPTTYSATSNGTYYLRARDNSSNLWSTSSTGISVTIDIVPAVPTALEEVSNAATSFTARWSSVSGADSYELDVSTNSSFSSFVSGYNAKSVTGTSHSVTGLQTGRNYYYRVRSKTNAGCESTSSSSTITANTTISPPSANQESSNATTSFVANWSAVSGVSGYLLYVSENSSFSSHVSGFNGKSVTGTSHTVTGLSAGKNYYYRLRSDGPSFDSGYSGYITANTTMPAPVATAATNISNTAFRANWNAVAGATNYLLDVSDQSNFSTYLTGYQDFEIPGAATSFTMIGLTAGKHYYYRLKAEGPDHTSVESNQITATTSVTAPVASQETSVTTSSFQANWGSVTGVTDYRLDVSESNTFGTYVSGYQNRLVSGATHESVTGLTAGKHYYYLVRSVGEDVSSANSNVITANTTIAVPLAIQETANTNTGFQANWSTVSGAVSYGLDVSENSGFSTFLTGYNNKTIFGGTTSNTTVTGLVAGKNYYYRVRANGVDVTSAPSGTITANTLIQAPVTTAASSITGTSFTANWNAVSGVTNYLLDVSTDSNFGSYVTGYQNLNVSATSQSVTGLDIGTTYYYRVTAVGGTTNSSESSVITVSTTISIPVATVATNATTGSFRANWNTVSGATNYLLDVSDQPDFSTYLTGYQDFEIPGAATSFTMIGLTPGKIYYYRLKAKGPNVTSTDSNIITASTLMTTPAVSEESAATDNSFQANWPATSGASSYRLDVSSTSDFNNILGGYNDLTVTGTSQSVSGLAPGQYYYYRLRAVSADNITSASSSTITANTTIAAPVATAASNATVSGFQANWNAVSGVSSYSLDVSTGSGFSTLLTGYNNLLVSGTSQSVSGLLPGKNYYYRVRARGNDLTSGNSQTITSTTAIIAPFVADASSVTTTSFQANWSAVAGISDYRLDVSAQSDFASLLAGYDSLLVTGATSQSVTGLTPGKTYYYRLRSQGEAAVSERSLIKPVNTTISAPTANQETNATTTSFQANWSAVTGAVAYRIDVADDAAFTNIRSAYNNQRVVGTSLVVTGLEAGNNYYYRVRAEGEATTSANSGAITATTLPDPVIQLMGSPILGTGDEVILYTGQAYATYDWKKDGVSVGSGSTYTATATGDYTVTVTLAGISTSGTSAAVTLSAATGFDPGDQNYVMSTTVLTDSVFTESQVDTLTTYNRSISIQYADGLGRPIQTVGVEAAPDQSHLVQPITYDAFGRQTQSYLPYVVTDNAGVFQHNPTGNATTYTKSPQYQFYQNAANVAHDTAPYAETVFDNSPLNRPLKQGAPGAAWQPVDGSTTDKVVRMDYQVNAASEVRLYNMALNTPIPVTTDGFYAAGELTKNITEDEEGNQVTEFTDKLGRVVLKQVETGDTNDPWAETHYIYDEYGNLRVVLPPEASKAVADGSLNAVPAGYTLVTADLTLTSANYTGGSYMYIDDVEITLDPDLTINPEAEIVPYGISHDFLNLWAFQYTYDHRNRMIAKRVPGAGWVYMVYDKLDRLVLTQDANQRNNNQWTFTKYDVFSRPVLTGFYTNGGDQDSMQNAVDAHATLNETPGTAVHGYTNNAFPNVSTANDYLTATYYDAYSNLPAEFTFSYSQQLGNGAKNDHVKGQVVGSKTRVLNSTDWLKSVVYYDDRYRVLQTVADNHLGGEDRSTSQYDFAGRVLQTKTTHDDGTVAADIDIVEAFTYDHASRLMKATHRVGTGDTITLVENKYNALGELIEKNLHSLPSGGAGGGPEQSVDYRYNIRGWLQKINDAALSDSEGDYFGMELAYNTTFSGITSTAAFNGNISAAKWSNIGKGGSIQSAYAYSYDAMNRLTGADYAEKVLTWADKNTFDVDSLTYDLNGNIQVLRRYATNNMLAMDELNYSYTGNQLLAVTDNGNTNKGFKDGNTSGNDYAYDVNGNMTSDANKDITAISYNHLNLPDTVSFTGNRQIAYTYDAAGIKLAKRVMDATDTTLTDYVGGFIYENSTLQQLAHAEGRVRRKDNGDMVYDYYLKDHLGNTRVTFTTESDTVVYLATMETEHATFEESLFTNISIARETNSTANYTVDATITADEVVRLRGNDANRQIGPGKLLEVMPGDSVAMEAFAYHTGTYTDNGSTGSSAFLTALIGMINGVTPAGTESSVVQNAVNTNSAAVFVGTDGNSSNPRAYLNYILFDQDFDYVDAGFVQVSGTSGTHVGVNSGKKITERGYIYVYVSNESDNSFDVFFDDLRITHIKGKIMQEDHYYPFGGSIVAQSSTAPLSKPNSFLYNEGSEKVFSFDLGVYETPSRILDPILGRWWQVDPAADLMVYQSPFSSMDNNPILLNDPFGDCPTCPQDPEEADKIYKVGAIVENNKGKWEYLGDGKWKDLITIKVVNPEDRRGQKVMKRRDGFGGPVDDFLGMRSIVMDDGLVNRVYAVNYEGLIVGVPPITGMPPDITPVGRVGSLYKIAKSQTLRNAVSGFKGSTWRFGKNVFRLDKNGLKHILKRHHPSYWDGSVKQAQSFLPNSWTIKDVQKAISNTMAQNRNMLKNRSTNSGMFQLTGKYKGRQIVIGFNNGRIGQMYVK